MQKKPMNAIINYTSDIKLLKSAILQSRYRAASLVNKELLFLYFAVGKFISTKIKEEKWGAKVLEKLSTDLQNELPGLRGFSATNIKRMRLFFETWSMYIPISPTLSEKAQNADFHTIEFSPLVTDELRKSFIALSFTNHIEIIQNTKKLDERMFYIQKAADEFWSLTSLKKLMD
jgi:predicted nuclease of restriction endonuclease-like (RecB) superfamily